MRMWHSCLILDGVALQLWRALPIVPACLAVRLFVKYVHQLESVAIRQTWCERIRESICWHSGQRYVINADFTLHWIELAMIATSPPLIHPIKPSLFIYLQPQPPDMHGMSELGAPHIHTHTHSPHCSKSELCSYFTSSLIPSEAVKDTHRYLYTGSIMTFNFLFNFFFFTFTQILTFCIFTHTWPCSHTHSFFCV